MDGQGRLATWLLLALGAGAVVNGLIMLFATEAWFTRIAADTGALNLHLVRDVGAAYVTSGVSSLWAARAPRLRAPRSASCSASRRPMPLDAPVTSARRPR